MASYPNTIYEPRTRANRSGVTYDTEKQTVWFKEDADNIENEIIAIENELGTNPKGAFASVAAFLSALLDAVIGAFTDIPDVPGSYVGEGGKVVKVKATEDGLEFGEVDGGGMDLFNTDFYHMWFPVSDGGLPANVEKGGNVSTDNKKWTINPPTNGSVAYIGLQSNIGPLTRNWANPHKMRFPIKEYYWTAGNWLLITGSPDGKRIGFKKTGNKLYGVVYNGATETTVELETVVDSWATRVLTFDYTGSMVTFYINDVDMGSINTNLPIGIETAPYLLYVSAYRVDSETRMLLTSIELYIKR